MTHKQKGQVLAVTAAFLVMIGLASILLFNSNKVVSERIRLQNTADAAAYSTATMDARYLNFLAYSNRAMIADHVITAQAIGIASYGRMLNQTGSNLCMFLCWIPYYGSIYINILSQVLNYYSSGLDWVADIVVPSSNILTKIISRSQQIYASVLPLASIALTRTVVEANDHDASLSTLLALGHAKDFHNFTQQFDPEDSGREDKNRTKEFYGATMNSRNKFTAERSGGWAWMEFKIPFVVEFSPVKYGGTDMRNDRSGPRRATENKTWAAMDTLSLSLRTWGCTNWLGIPRWCRRVEIPLGYGGGTAGDSYSFSNDRRTSLYGNGAWKNSWGATLQATYGSTYENNNYDGLQPFYDLKQSGKLREAPEVIVALTKNQTDVRTSNGIGINAERTDITQNGNLYNNKLVRIASASAYFRRPQDLESGLTSNPKREYGNLYNPFWQPRLKDLSFTRKSAFQRIATL